MRIVTPSIELIWVTPDPLIAIEKIARTCYKSEDKITKNSAEKFVAMLIKRGHWAMIEHAEASFRFVIDRGISHEAVRHRLPSFAQESTRYCNYAKDKFDKEITVIQPPFTDVEIGNGAVIVWRRACLDAEKRYFRLLEAGCSPQIARSVLPTCLKTELVITANFREWHHILDLRTSKAAHPQIRQVMNRVLSWFNANYPVIVEDLVARNSSVRASDRRHQREGR